MMNVMNVILMKFFVVIIAESSNGIVIEIHEEYGSSPIITLETELNQFRDTHCYQFKRVFESVNDDQIIGSSVDLSNKRCRMNQISSMEFDIVCHNINNGIISFEFQFTQNKDGMLFIFNHIYGQYLILIKYYLKYN